MRIIKNIFFSLLALSLIVCTGVFIFFETFDTDPYLLPMTNKASLALGRPVSIGHVGLGFSSRGITLDAGPLTIADDKGFTTQPFIKVDRVRISLDLRTLFLKRDIHITEILLQSPQIHFIRSLEGNINARSITQASRPAGVNTAVNAGPGVSVVVPAASGSAPENAPRNDARKAFPAINIKSIKIQDASISFIDQNQGMPLDIWLSNINATLNDFSLSKPFRLSFNASLYSNDPNVHGSALVSLTPVRVSNLSLHMDLSQVDIKGLKGISPEMYHSPALKKIMGAVQLNMVHLDVGASGDFEARGDLIITNGVIKNFNILNTVLSHTLGVFGGMDSIKDKSGAGDTVIERSEAKFSFHDKTFFIDDSLIKTNIFELTAKGSVDQGLNTDMQTMLHLNSDLSASLVNEFEGLQLLEDDSKRIAIDASLNGVFPHLKYKPNKDFRKKSKKALIEEGGNMLDALLGGGQTPAQEQDFGKKPKKNFKNIFMNLLK
jgi:AsmA family